MPASSAENMASVIAQKGEGADNTARMPITRVFQNGNSQALRIPQSLRTDKKEFFIRKIGDIFIAYPTDDPWAPARQVVGTFPENFLADRNQPSWDDAASREEL